MGNTAFTIQFIGIIGFLVGVIAFLNSDDKLFKYIMSVASAIMSLHFLMLGSNAGAMMTALAAIRLIIAANNKYPHLGIIFIIINLCLGYLLFTNMIDLLPVIAAVIATYSIFYLQNIKMRYGLSMASACWLIHNIAKMSIGGILMELTFIAVNIYVIYKMMKINKNSSPDGNDNNSNSESNKDNYSTRAA
ncbi:MAG: YgjV family protein [Pseudomonadota bacterium]